MAPAYWTIILICLLFLSFAGLAAKLAEFETARLAIKHIQQAKASERHRRR
jgi:hypothetical protein